MRGSCRKQMHAFFMGIALALLAPVVYADANDESCKGDALIKLANLKAIKGGKGARVGDEKYKNMLKALEDCKLTHVEIYRPVDKKENSAKVIELNPYPGDGIYIVPNRRVFIYIGVFPFVTVDKFVGQKLEDVVADGPGATRGKKLSLGESIESRCTLDPSTDRMPGRLCEPLLRASYSCSVGTFSPPGSGIPWASKIKKQVPQKGSLIGVDYYKPNAPNVQLLSNFPLFYPSPGQPMVHLELDCGEPRARTCEERGDCPPPPPPSTCETRGDCPTTPWLPPAVLGAVAGAALTRRLLDRKTRGEPVSSLPVQLPTDRVVLRSRPDLP